MTELSESSSDGFVASTCDFFFSGVSVKSFLIVSLKDQHLAWLFFASIFFATLKRVD